MPDGKTKNFIPLSHLFRFESSYYMNADIGTNLKKLDNMKGISRLKLHQAYNVLKKSEKSHLKGGHSCTFGWYKSLILKETYNFFCI
jgi:hypothetical protein